MTIASKSAPLSVWRPIATDTFLVGTPHYPEHVDESYWQRDVDRMAVRAVAGQQPQQGRPGDDVTRLAGQLAQ